MKNLATVKISYRKFKNEKEIALLTKEYGREK